MKTATIKVYKTKFVSWVDVTYRNKLLESFYGSIELFTMNQARTWAISNGFDKIRYTYVVGGN